MAVDLGMAQLNQLAFGYWQSQVLFAAVTTGVFDALADGPLPATEVGDRCSIAADPALRLLDACVALRLLTRSPDGEYANTTHAQRLLTSSSPESVVRWTRVMARWYEPWGDIARALRDGGSVEDRTLRLGKDPEYVADFILGMHQYNARSADVLAGSVDQQGARRLVDVGGGAGTYSVAFCRAWQGLRCEVVDLDGVVPLARETVEAAGLTDRIRVRAGDYYTDSFGAGDTDVVLLSNVLHQESPPTCVDILRRARAALADGGRVLVHGHFLDEARTSPPFTTLHNLSSLVLWDGGRSYTAAEMTALMKEAGLIRIHELPAPEASAKLLVGQVTDDGHTA
jgi:precorrin-6B methylase 2